MFRDETNNMHELVVDPQQLHLDEMTNRTVCMLISPIIAFISPSCLLLLVLSSLGFLPFFVDVVLIFTRVIFLLNQCLR